MEENAKSSNEDPAWTTDEFRIYEYKVKRCSRSRPHDWTQCPFSHSGEKAKRRDPRRFAYTGAACPDYRKNASCRRGDKCPFAHGVFESWLHPSRYRTQCCTDGVACKRRVCFFAHQESELRKPEDDPALLSAQLQAEALASTETYQQILASASLDTVPEVAPASNASPQLNLAILQSLLQNNGVAQRLPAGWSADGDAQERGRMFQLQALLAALQLRAPAPPLPPQPAHSDALSNLDRTELGRLLAANQALVQQQAEREMLQRSSFEAARRNSMSSDVGMGSDMGRQDSYLGHQGSGLLTPADSGFGDGGGNARSNYSPGIRRMSMDSAGPHLNGSQGLDPRILAALAAAQRVNAPGAQAGSRNAAAFRRSVDMGMLAHAAALSGAGRHGGNSAGFGKQFGEPASIPEDSPGMEARVQQQHMEPSAFASAFNQGAGPMDGGQGSGFLAAAGQPGGMEQLLGQLAPADQAALLQSQDGLAFQCGTYGNGQMNGQNQEVRRYLEQLGNQPSGHMSRQTSEHLSVHSGSGQFGGQGLSAQNSAAHLGSFGGQFLSQGSGQLSSLGQMSGQASSGLGSYGQPMQPQTSGNLGSLQGHIGQPRYSPGRCSFSSADSLGRLSDIQHQQLAHLEEHMKGGWSSSLEGDMQQQQGGGGGLQGNNGGGVGERGGRGGSAESLQLHEDGGRAAEEQYGASGSSTPSRGPPTPGVQGNPQQHSMVSPRDQAPSMHSSLYASSPASHTTTYDTSPRNMSMGMVGQPSIPEEAPHNWQPGPPQPSASEAYPPRRMPTLLEQLQLFERQRQSSMPALNASLAMARNTSFESLSAELPRSISDLNLAEHNLGNNARIAPSIPASST